MKFASEWHIEEVAEKMSQSLAYKTDSDYYDRFSKGKSTQVHYIEHMADFSEYNWDIFQKRIWYGNDEGNYIPNLSLLLLGNDILDPTLLLVERCDISDDDVDPTYLEYVLIFNKPVKLTDEICKNICRGYEQISSEHMPVKIRTYISDNHDNGYCVDTKYCVTNCEKFKTYSEQEWEQILEERNR